MKTLIIARVDPDAMSLQYQWIGDEKVNTILIQKLIDADFDMTQAIYIDRDQEGNRRYRQLEQGEQEADLG